jgi:UDPglucose 6-dehydrogenase
MKITVIGTGYVGLVTGACLAELGNDVICYDIDEEKIKLLNNGISPIFEDGLESIIKKNLSAHRLHFSTNAVEAVHHGKVIFIAVGTPTTSSGAADLSQVEVSAKNIGQWINEYKVIVNKSTVPVGTADRVREIIQSQIDTLALNGTEPAQFTVLSNPEFLKEGCAVDDFMRPDRIILGIDPGPNDNNAKDLMNRLYAPFNRHHERTLVMNVRSAEFTKYASNAMLATRISFMNELANLAEQIHVDIESVRKGMGADPRIGYSFLYAGVGYGGSCFPKDIKALQNTANKHGLTLEILKSVELVNDEQKQIMVHKITKRFGADLSAKTFAVWGLSFKPNTDDMREAPSLKVIKGLLSRGARVRVYDPVSMQAAQKALLQELSDQPQLFEKIEFIPHQYEVLENAQALLIVTEWKEFKSPDFHLIHQTLKLPVIFDGRNLFEPEVMQERLFEYYGVGRHNSAAEQTSSAHAA